MNPTRSALIDAIVLDVFREDPRLRVLGPADRDNDEEELRGRIIDAIGEFLGEVGSET